MEKETVKKVNSNSRSEFSDVQQYKKDLQDQHDAILNILEDVTESESNLKIRLEHIQVLRDTIESITTSISPNKIMDIVARNVNKLVPNYSLSFVIWKGEGVEYSKLVYIYAKGSIGKVYLKHIQKDFLHYLKKLPSNISNRSSFIEQVKKNIYPEILTGVYDDKWELTPTTHFVVPFVVNTHKQTSQSYLMGMFHIASINPREVINDEHFSLVENIARVAASNLSHIKIIAQTEQGRMANLLRSLSNGVILFDSLKNVLLSNPASMKMLGFPEIDPTYHKGAYVSFSDIERLFSSQGKDFVKNIDQVLAEGKDFHIAEFPLVSFTYEVWVVPVRNLQKVITGGAMIIHDITHLKEIDRMKTEFVSIASHQLRTPLTAIKLFVEMLNKGKGGKLTIKQNEYIQYVSNSTERMIRLVNDLLNVSRLETGRMKIVPQLTRIDDFIQNVINDTQSLAQEQKCKIFLRKPKIRLPEIAIDQTLIRQVIHNLLTNAIRYSPKQQCNITVGIQQRNHETKKQKSQNTKPNSEVLISVKDLGIGIPKKSQTKIFEKFFRADNALKQETEGSGLGMYVAKMILAASGGNIWFESEGENKGTTFYVSLPMKGMVKKEGEKGLA